MERFRRLAAAVSGRSGDLTFGIEGRNQQLPHIDHPRAATLRQVSDCDAAATVSSSIGVTRSDTLQIGRPPPRGQL